jgi:hypothetical protein
MLKAVTSMWTNSADLPADRTIGAVLVRPPMRFPTSNSQRLSSMLATLLLCCMPLSHAQPDEAPDDKDTAPKEIAISLPAPPLPENLLPFAGGPNPTQSFSIDAKSLNIAPDGVIRYTLIAQSPSGASNISHEGLRCQSMEMKLYALGHKDGSWSRSRRDQWQAISFRSQNRPQAVLAQDYFCQWGAAAGTAEDMLGRIRNKRPLAQ